MPFRFYLIAFVALMVVAACNNVERNRTPAKASALPLQSLKGSRLNGLFGSGLPGTMGIQLLLGANLKAYAEETNTPLVIGRRCKLVSQRGQAFRNHYLKGSKFAFRETVKHQEKTEFVFDNWSHSPHQLRVECIGNHEKMAQMTLAEVERDLNGTVQFYHQ